MSRVITFSTAFPAHHPRKGDPTNFVEKILIALYPHTDYFMCKCEGCGWMGYSCCCGGGGQIADTGDYFDAICPKCYSAKLDGDFDERWDIGYYKHLYRPKIHTIRAGNRWKAGDKFSPKVWSGKPYQSKQITIAPDIEIKRVAPFKMDENGVYSVDGKYTAGHDEDWLLAQNDGLTDIDMFHWLMKDYDKPKVFEGQLLVFGEGDMPYLNG